MGEVRSISSKKTNREAFFVEKTKGAEYFCLELSRWLSGQIGHDSIAFVLLPLLKPAKKINLGF